ncbi:MAG: hypothetical protein U5J95_06945 [Balneolaceae bacterium]|nr:hypothetical protein [Balneolaceae bacterium]
MNKKDYNEDPFMPSGSEDVDNSFSRQTKITGAIDQVHSVNTLHMVAGVSLIFLSLSVILLSVLGLLQPLWLSTALSMIASVSTMIGLFFLYSVAYQSNDPNRLLRDAMKRIMEAKN